MTSLRFLYLILHSLLWPIAFYYFPYLFLLYFYADDSAEPPNSNDAHSSDLTPHRGPQGVYDDTEEVMKSIAELLEAQEGMPEGAGIYHPVDSYLLMKRLSVGWNKVQDSMEKLHNDTRSEWLMRMNRDFH